MRFPGSTNWLKFIAISSFVFFAFLSHSQSTLKVYLKDPHHKPVSSAIIKYQNVTLYSNEAGFFKVNEYRSGSTLTIHRFGFADTSITATTSAVHDSINLTIRLRYKSTVLQEITVSSAIKKEINPLKSAFVMGYELKDNYIVEFLNNDKVLVIDEDGKIISSSKPLSGIKDLVKDAGGNLHLTTERSAVRIHPETSALRVDTAYIDPAKLNWNVKYCDEVCGQNMFIRRYKDNNQTVAIFAMSDLAKNKGRMLKEITEADKKYAVASFANETNALLYYLSTLPSADMGEDLADISDDERELRRTARKMVAVLEKNYVLPSYSVIKLINDSLYLFAHDIDTMFVYDQRLNLIKRKKIAYHHMKSWDREIIVNEEKTRVFAKLLQDSKPTLAEIDLQTGMLKPDHVTIEARFPNRIRIRNNSVYFMAKQTDGTGNTVYVQTLPLRR